jgi:hypothetical protein
MGNREGRSHGAVGREARYLVRLLVISPAHDVHKAEGMIATARRVGIEPVIYGLNSTHPHGKDYQGSDIIDILKERTDAEYVMGVDAYDVAFVGGEDEIVDKFLNEFDKFSWPFVISAEQDGVSGLDKTKWEIYRLGKAVGAYHTQPNIGGWIGKRMYALEVFNAAERLWRDRPEDPTYSYDNHFQWLAMMYAWGAGEVGKWMTGAPEFAIDWHCRIFQSMNKVDRDVEWVGGDRLRNVKTSTLPPILHFNGDPTRGRYAEAVRRILGTVRSQ